MAERRATGGLYDFVDNDNLSYLDNKLGKHAPRMGWKKRTTWQKIKAWLKSLLR